MVSCSVDNNTLACISRSSEKINELVTNSVTIISTFLLRRAHIGIGGPVLRPWGLITVSVG